MSQRPNHTAMGLAFILGCLIIAFAIYVAMKTAPEAVAPNAAVAADGNVAASDAMVAAASDNATEPADSAYPPAAIPSQPDTGPQETSPTSPADHPSSSAPTAPSEGASIPHAQFVAACVTKDGDAFNGMDDVDKSAMCECLYDHARTYDTLTPENGKMAIGLCRVRWATDRTSFRNDYAPGADARDITPPEQQERQ